MSNVSFDYWADVLGRKCLQVLDVTFLHCVKSHYVLQDMSAEDVAREVTAGAAAAPNPIPFSTQPHTPTPCPQVYGTGPPNYHNLQSPALSSSAPRPTKSAFTLTKSKALRRRARPVLLSSSACSRSKSASRARVCAAALAADVCVFAAVMVRELRRSTQALYSAVCSSAGTHALPPDASQPLLFHPPPCPL